MSRPAPKCFVCGSGKAWFGYGPPGWTEQLWACRAHRWDAELLRVKSAAEQAVERAATTAKSGTSLRSTVEEHKAPGNVTD